MPKISRRDFLRFLMTLSAAGVTYQLSGCDTQEPNPTALPATHTPPPTEAGINQNESPTPEPPPAITEVETPTTEPRTAYLAVARGAAPGPAELTRLAIAAVGGIQCFVSQGADVIIKPNICNGYHGPEYASTTNPEVVAAIVALCVGAGAGRVRVMDFPFGGTAKNAYKKSGIAQVVEASGGQMELMNSLKYQKVDIPNALALKKTEIYADILDADTLINVPIAKHHSNARLTLGLKNMMGVVQDRRAFHARGLHKSIADLSTIVKPHLTVIDATRILVANGPTGGSLDDVRQMDTVIASADVVAADAYAATLFGMVGADMDYIVLADQLGQGTMDLNSIDIEEINA
jgi:uncharacterized protein (DUF362 family)